MSLRWTGWMLTAVLICAGTGTVLGGVDPAGDEDRSIEATVPSLADSGNGYADCLEVMIVRRSLILRGGEVLLLQHGMELEGLDKVLRRSDPLFNNADERLLDELVRTGRSFDPPKRPWPSLPAGELLPHGDTPGNLIGSACGIPQGMTFLVPSARVLSPSDTAI